MDKNGFEDIGKEIWIRLLQESEQPHHEQIEVVKKQYE